MKKIQKYLFLLVSLLTTTAWADNYQIIELKTGGLGAGTLTADYAVLTDIAYNTTVTLTATPGDGCFLDKIEIEYVMNLDGAESRGNRSPSIFTPSIFTVGQTINRNSNYKDQRYGGAYSFNMPAYNVIITAYFVTSIPLSNFRYRLRNYRYDIRRSIYKWRLYYPECRNLSSDYSRHWHLFRYSNQR